MFDARPILRGGPVGTNVLRCVLLCWAVLVCMPAMAQPSSNPALKGKGNLREAEVKRLQQQRKENEAASQARLLELKDRIKRENAKRGIVPLSERMKPAGSYPAPSPGNPNPVRR